ncbi:MAG: S1C family serine protease [Tistlia sp.]|uniref:S1C family serine protease n=1 Tax=Tistlia sp. TaxID=3057121 RepID=UPI0034A4F689
MKNLLSALLLLPLAAAGALAQGGERPLDPRSLDLSAVVGIEATILPEGSTAGSLGSTRLGNGVLIDAAEGLVLTIGYVVLEAAAVDLLIAAPDPAAATRRVPAEVLAYDGETGFGILRASARLGLEAMAIGESAALEPRDPLLSVTWSDAGPVIAPALLMARREFAGYWEYLLPDALFAAPSRPNWAGAALLDAEGRLVGLGSLQVGDTIGAAEAGGPVIAGNMYVPIDALKPIYGELVSFGRSRKAARPWLGLHSTELRGQVVVVRTTERSPAAEAGIEPGEIVQAVKGEPVTGLADFYRKLWALGDAGVEVPLTLRGPDGRRELTVKSVDRVSRLRLDQTL